MAEETKETLDKKKIEKIKLLLSSLFSRSQKYLLVDGNNKGRLVFTNFPYERVILYKSEPEDIISTVSITNSEISDILYEAFPMLGSIVAEIHLQQFLAAVNKCLADDKTKWPEIVVDKETDKLFMTHAKEGEAITAEIGRLLPPDALSFYDKLVEDFMSFTRKFMDIQFGIPDGHYDDPVIFQDLTISDPENDEHKVPEPTVTFKCPLKDGIPLVSFKEYIKKRELPVMYTGRVQYRPETRSAKIGFGYSDDWLTSWSIMPGSLWFPFV